MFDRLAQKVSGAARRTVDEIRKAHAHRTAPSVFALADALECDERSIRTHLTEIEKAIEELAAERSLLQFSYQKRASGRKQPVRYELVLHSRNGHSERFLHGFRKLGAESGGGEKEGPVIYLLRRGPDDAAYPPGATELVFPLARLLREPGWEPEVAHQISGFEEQIWTSTRPVIVLCGNRDFAGERMPDFAFDPPVLELRHESGKRRYDFVTLIRFVNDMGQPVLLVRSDGLFGHLAFKVLLDNNVSAGKVFEQLQLADTVLAPAEYQIGIRVDMIPGKNIPSGHGDPQVVRPYHFDPPPARKPVGADAGKEAKLEVVRR